MNTDCRDERHEPWSEAGRRVLARALDPAGLQRISTNFPVWCPRADETVNR